ncbi:uncharacterized protein LOC133832582 [Humulus lupulus]|uniref:uncharacterized protein LOC133832582 n=1 Tax=Humulus lupulus TaxID=3486 RepID=UPI002B417E3C|nr:uncharacterized protein LOC133832582 [Humulus lupulus]
MLNNRPQGNLPGNTVVNPKEQCQAITLRSGKQVDQSVSQSSTEKSEEVGETSNSKKKGVTEDHHVTERAPPVAIADPKVRIPYPQRLQKNSLDKQFSKFLEVFMKLHINIPFAEALEQMPSYVKFKKEILSKKRKMEDYEIVVLIEERSAILQRRLPQKLRDPGSCFEKNGSTDALEVVLKQYEEEDSDDAEVMDYVKWVNSYGPYYRKKYEELGKVLERPILSIENPPELELKTLPDHLRYAYLGEKETLPVIVSSFLSNEEVEKLLRVLRAHKLAIGWTLEDMRGISLLAVMHKIRMEDNSKPSIEAQRRLNPTMKEVVRKEILKWLDAGVVYPIFDSAWVSPFQVVPKKGGMTMVKNEKNELIPTRTIAIASKDQEKTTFTCPNDTFAFPRIPFGLCNAPATFQRCMMAIFSHMVEKSMEIFMDDFSIFGSSFDECLNHLEAVSQCCEESNMVLS